jgi:2',3'-cyclic-nucleotide 2'-phosphodiesterase (5'-nucleotidase family)
MANKYSTKNVDVALQNYGGFRIPFLPKGPITKGNVYELMPFDNKLVVLELSAGLTRRLIDQMSNDGGWPISKGLNYKIEYGAASDIKIAGNDLDESKTYRIAMPDYVANGGGDCDFLIAIEQEDTGVFIRDIIIEYLLSLQQEGKEIKIDNAKRIF